MSALELCVSGIVHFILFLSVFFHSALLPVRFIPVVCAVSLLFLIDARFPLKQDAAVFPLFCWWAVGLFPVSAVLVTPALNTHVHVFSWVRALRTGHPVVELACV